MPAVATCAPAAALQLAAARVVALAVKQKLPSTAGVILCYLVAVKLLILYRPNSEHETDVESYVRDFQHRYEIGRKIELVSMNTRDGAATASLYDIVAYPAILVLGDDGSLVSFWQGMPLPLMDEVAGFAHSASSTQW